MAHYLPKILQMKAIAISILFLFPLQLFSQTVLDSLVDTRDGAVYEIAKVGDVLWFKDNLRFETDSSHCPNYARKPDVCANGNFYSYRELDKVCPQGWRIPTDKEWNEYFLGRLEAQKGSISDVVIDTMSGEFLSIQYRDQASRVALFGETNPIGLEELGWVEGKRLRNKQTTTIWVKQTGSRDARFHLHIGNDGYVIHNHRHHIDDKARRSRKFMVKCVSRLD